MPREKSPQAKLLEDVKHRFKFHPATETTGPQHDAVRADLGRLAQKLAKNLPVGREQSLALTHLEETMFWANAAIARNQQPAVASSDAPDKVAERPASTPEGRVRKERTAKKSTRRVTRTKRT